MKTLEELDGLRRLAMNTADDLVKGKGEDYGHWSGMPSVAIAALTFVKAQRLLELTVKIAADPDHEATNEPLEDSCLDIINYASFLWAKEQARKADA